MSARLVRICVLLLMLAGMSWLAQGAYIQVKAVVAQVLLQSAWQQTLSGDTAVKPWAWADTWPVARILMPAHGVDLIVLEGATGSSLAFAPGHLQGSPSPGDRGYAIISAHRDTHFAFLRDVQPGDSLQIESASGELFDYQVTSTQVVEAEQARLPDSPHTRGVILVTCYPFDDLGAGATQRFLVYASERSVDS